MRKTLRKVVVSYKQGVAVKIFFRLLLVCYLVTLFYLVFLSSHYGRGKFHRDYEFIPFKNMINTIAMGNIAALKVNILGNILAFIPLGFLTPLVFPNMRNYKKVILVSLCSTVFIESMQFVLAVGVAEIDDIILNVLGGILGLKLAELTENLLYNFSKQI